MTAAAEPVWLQAGEPFTRADLQAMPDDGHRYELIDGSVVVTPAPSFGHQSAAGELYSLLKAECPRDLKVLFAPFDVVLSVDTLVQPDLLVARRADFTERDLSAPPLLAVEILSPSTRRIDLMLKQPRYEAAGCPSFWVVDLDEPSITAWGLQDGAYVLAGRASGEESLSLELPFPVTIVPARLLD